MPLYHVTYDLTKNEDSDDYAELRDAIIKAGGVKTQYSAWLVGNACTLQELYSYLKPHVFEKDRLMVIQIERRPKWNTGFKGTQALIDQYFPS